MKTFTCIACKQQVSRRKSLAVLPGTFREEDQYVIARDKNKKPITRKALPRKHRGECPQE